MITRGPFEVITVDGVIEVWVEDAIAPFLELTADDAIHLALQLERAVKDVASW